MANKLYYSNGVDWVLVDDGGGGGGGGGSLTVQDENGNVATNVTQIDFQGAGVTAAAGTGEVVVTIPGGGGGGGGSVEYPDDPATYGGANLGYDVEFDGAGSALPAGWAWFNQGTSTWETKNGLGLLTPQLGTGSDGGQRFILRDLPTEATWQAVLKTSGSVPRPSNNAHLGLVLRNSADGRYTAFAKRKGGSVARLNFSALENYVTGSILDHAGVGESPWIYLMIERLAGGNYTYRYSLNGYTWVLHTANLGPYAAFNQIGLWVQSSGGEATPHPFSWFRVR